MRRTLEAALLLARRLPPSRIEAIASGLLTDMSMSTVSTSVSSNEAKQFVREYMEAIQSDGISREVGAAILLSSEHTYRSIAKEQNIELVITGPDTPFVATRRTEQVLLDLILQAKNELFLVSFVAGDWHRIIEALKNAHHRGVTIRVLLEASKAHGGTLEHDQSKELLRAIPDAKFYRWLEKGSEHQGGKVHAKIALADDKIAFISSANFTGHAMEKNLEAGLLVSGGHVPLDLKMHLKGLIELDIITEVSSQHI